MIQPAKLKPKQRLIVAFGRPLLSGVVRALAWTMKIEFVNWDRAKGALNSGRPVILGVWHGNIFSLLMARLATQVPFFLTMASLSKDGEMAAQLLWPIGADFVRGSSSKGGAAALGEAIGRIEAEGRGPRPLWVLHLMDGPRGPRRKPKPGIVKMAWATGALIVPVEIGLSRRIRVGSWDRHRIPLPFTRMTVIVGEPLDWPAPETEAGGEDEGAARDRLAERVAELEAAMEALCLSEPLAAADM